MYDDIPTLMAQIQAGGDSLPELKEVVFQQNRIRFALEEGSAKQTLAEVFASMANTEGGVVVFDVNDDGSSKRYSKGFEIVNSPGLEERFFCRRWKKPQISQIPGLEGARFPRFALRLSGRSVATFCLTVGQANASALPQFARPRAS